MHSLIHAELADAAAPHRLPPRGHKPPRRPERPPGGARLRGHAARGLASLARRLDREQARRAIA
jgi:hypothetical protein